MKKIAIAVLLAASALLSGCAHDAGESGPAMLAPVEETARGFEREDEFDRQREQQLRALRQQQNRLSQHRREMDTETRKARANEAKAAAAEKAVGAPAMPAAPTGTVRRICPDGSANCAPARPAQ